MRNSGREKVGQDIADMETDIILPDITVSACRNMTSFLDFDHVYSDFKPHRTLLSIIAHCEFLIQKVSATQSSGVVH